MTREPAITHFDRQVAAMSRWCRKRGRCIFIPLKGQVQILRK